jgi:hypothetical protein
MSGSVLFARHGAYVAIVYLPEDQSDAEVTQSTVVAEGRRCLLILGDVRDSNFCNDAVYEPSTPFVGSTFSSTTPYIKSIKQSIDDLTDEQFEWTVRFPIIR